MERTTGQQKKFTELVISVNVKDHTKRFAFELIISVNKEDHRTIQQMKDLHMSLLYLQMERTSRPHTQSI
jgi:hypothetical protein